MKKYKIYIMIYITICVYVIYPDSKIFSTIDKKIKNGEQICMLIVSSIERTDIQQYLIDRYGKETKFSLITRNAINNQLIEYELSLTDFVDSSKNQLRIGQLLTATHLLIDYGNDSYSIIEVATGKVVGSSSVSIIPDSDTINKYNAVYFNLASLYSSTDWTENGLYGIENWSHEYWGFLYGFRYKRRISETKYVSSGIKIGYINDWLVDGNVLEQESGYFNYQVYLELEHYITNEFGLFADIGITNDKKAMNGFVYGLGIDYLSFQLSIQPIPNGLLLAVGYKFYAF